MPAITPSTGAVIGRMVDVRADLGQVTVTCEGRLVACHDRSWVEHQTVTDPVHKQAADAMRAREAAREAGRAAGRRGGRAAGPVPL